MQTFKILETGIFAKDAPQKLIFLQAGEKSIFFCDRFFNLRSRTKPMLPMQISMHTNDTL